MIWSAKLIIFKVLTSLVCIRDDFAELITLAAVELLIDLHPEKGN